MTEIEILPRRNQQANMIERVAVVAKLSEEADLMKACRMIMEKVCGVLSIRVEFTRVQIVNDAKVNENMSNFNLIEQRRGKRPSGIGDDMRRTPMSMAMGYLTNAKPNRSFSQKRIPEKRGKIMSSLEVFRFPLKYFHDSLTTIIS